MISSPSGYLVLRVRGSSRDGQIVRLRSPKCTIGSGANCTFCLKSDNVGPVHCLILRSPVRTIVRRWWPDTRLNGRNFTESVLQTGDCLSIGPIDLEVIDTTQAEGMADEAYDRQFDRIENQLRALDPPQDEPQPEQPEATPLLVESAEMAAETEAGEQPEILITTVPSREAPVDLRAILRQSGFQIETAVEKMPTMSPAPVDDLPVAGDANEQPVNIVTPIPQSPKPTGATAEDDGTIDDYMSRLLARARGGAMPSSPPKAAFRPLIGCRCFRECVKGRSLAGRACVPTRTPQTGRAPGPRAPHHCSGEASRLASYASIGRSLGQLCPGKAREQAGFLVKRVPKCWCSACLRWRVSRC